MTNNGSTTPSRVHQGLSPDPADASDFNDTMSTSMKTYSFPRRKLSQKLLDPTKTPLVLVACGSFSPPTYLHLRMFEIAADYVRENTNFEIVGGYMSPVNSNYKKEGLESADMRVKMCMLATMGHDWLSVDDWEGLAPSYVPTAQVLDHFDAELRKIGGVEAEDGKKKPVRVALLAGADLISTFGTPGVWSPQDLEHILGRYGCFILERMGVDIDESLENLDRWISNIWFINQPITNDVSSTKIRLFLRKAMSIRYLIPTSVINFIYENELYNVKLPANGHERNPSGSKKPTPLPSPRPSPRIDGTKGSVNGADEDVDGATQGTE